MHTQMATFSPDNKLEQFVEVFIKEIEDDFQAPAQSKFQNYMSQCRKGVQSMEEVCMGRRCAGRRRRVCLLLKMRVQLLHSCPCCRVSMAHLHDLSIRRK